MIKKISALLLIGGSTLLFSDDSYTLGQGLKSDKFPLSLGGYITGFYSNRSDGRSVVSLDDVAVMAYGDIAPNISAMIEFESAGFYETTFQNATRDNAYKGTLRVERAYVNYSYNDFFELKVGKFITPAGLWNQTPVPVFKDTFSKPRLSLEIFPRFSTGAMVHGKVDVLDGGLEYSVFAQVGDDLDPVYNNVESSSSFGGSAAFVFDGWTSGIALGKYKNVKLDDDTEYLGVYQSYSNGPLKLMAEAFISEDEYHVATFRGRHYKKQSYYIQGAYKIAPKLTGVWRNEYFKNGFNNDVEGKNTIGINYKPHSAVSFKLEKQFSTQRANDIVIASFSVLF